MAKRRRSLINRDKKRKAKGPRAKSRRAPQYVSFANMFTSGQPKPPEEPLFDDLEIRLLKGIGVAMIACLVIAIAASATLFSVREEVWLLLEQLRAANAGG